jgi:hypothetical protein
MNTIMSFRWLSSWFLTAPKTVRDLDKNTCYVELITKSGNTAKITCSGRSYYANINENTEHGWHIVNWNMYGENDLRTFESLGYYEMPKEEQFLLAHVQRIKNMARSDELARFAK